MLQHSSQSSFFEIAFEFVFSRFEQVCREVLFYCSVEPERLFSPRALLFFGTTMPRRHAVSDARDGGVTSFDVRTRHPAL
jgi:hypothetical protein